MADHSEERNTLESYWRIVWGRKWLIGLFVLITTLAALVASSLMTPVYEASATLHLKEPMPSVLGGDLTGSGISALSTKEEVNTQVEILKSRTVLRKVIENQGLMDKLGIDAELSSGQRLQSALDSLRRNMSVGNIPNTRLIRVSIRSPDPKFAAEVANSISQVFIERDIESKRSEANAVLAFVSDQVELVSERLKTAEEQLLRYKEEHGIGVLSEEAQLEVNLLAQLESSFQQANVEREVLATRIGAVLGQLGPSSAAGGRLRGVASSPAIADMQARLMQAQMELAALEASGSPTDGPALAEVRGRVDSLTRNIQAAVEEAVRSASPTAVESGLQMQLAEYESRDVALAAQQNALRKLIEGHEANINRLPAREINLTRLQRAQRINDELYAALMRAKNEAQIEAARQIANIDVVDSAFAPLQPVRPRKKENALIAFVLSLLMGIGLAFLLEHLDRTIKSEDEVKKLLGIPILGLIPRFETNGHRAVTRRRQKRKAGLSLVARDDPQAAASEAFRMLRANLHFMDLDSELKTIMVTSPIPGDGKTTVAANLSVELAAQGARVLIVDADFRIPAVHRIFNLPESPGVTSVLSGAAEWGSAARKIDGVANLNVLTVGPVPPNSSELLGSARMREFIQELKGKYERIVFDAPPLLAATDAVDLAAQLDGVLLVLRMGEIDRRALRRVQDLLSIAKIRIVGGILNAVNTRDRGYGYGYYYHYERAEKRNGKS